MSVPLDTAESSVMKIVSLVLAQIVQEHARNVKVMVVTVCFFTDEIISKMQQLNLQKYLFYVVIINNIYNDNRRTVKLSSTL